MARAPARHAGGRWFESNTAQFPEIGPFALGTGLWASRKWVGLALFFSCPAERFIIIISFQIRGYINLPAGKLALFFQLY
jgi:hypothetical protein